MPEMEEKEKVQPVEVSPAEELQQTGESVSAAAQAAAPEQPKKLSEMERFYECFRGVPLKYLDVFIGICFALLIFFIVLGIIRGTGPV